MSIERKPSIRIITYEGKCEEFMHTIKAAARSIDAYNEAKADRNERAMMSAFNDLDVTMKALVELFEDCPAPLKPRGKLADCLAVVNLRYTNLHAKLIMQYGRNSPETPRSFKYDNPFKDLLE
ncbi:hypothetical protein E24_00205 [Faustovirus]|nr:hypothetical protein PRJ_Fausto_00192 [Faustovirus]AMN83135.1 hypothetical protein E24_00205 [Faustovirus]AMN84116.1 hypothetical protein D5a_00203 [Faustovirus]AMN85104.1 hypothetical protein E23_00204 [Faustovirus]QBR99102.1 hypothetical protein [Faustovirus mariensis]